MMRAAATALSFLALTVAAGCSVLVSTTGLSSGGDGDGGAAPETATPQGVSSPGIALGDAATAAATSSGPDGATPGAIKVDASSPSPPSSQPDAGKDSGAGVDAAAQDGGAKIDATPPPPPTACSLGHARVFVTSAMYDGRLGGMSGADATCSSRASAGALGGNWRAWLSDSSTAATNHIYASTGGYVLVDGTTTVATSFNALTSGSLSHAIDMSETGALIADGNTEVWTGIDVTSSLANGGFCTDPANHDWSSNTTSAPTPLVGHLDATDSTWSAAYLQVCNRTNVRLYCFETCP
jgi:hypothetical protein